MLNIKELKAQRAAEVDAMEALLNKADQEKRALTADEQKEFDGHEAKTKEIDGMIQRAETLLKIKPADPPAAQPQPTHVTVRQNALDKPWNSLGEQLMAIRTAATNPSGTDPRLLELSPEVRAATGLNEAVDAEGGFLIQPTFSATIIDSLYGDSSTLASACDRFPIGPQSNSLTLNAVDETSRANGSRWGGVRGYWQNEADALTATKPKWSQINLKLKKVTAAVYATDELLEDVTALEGYLRRVVPAELRFKLEDAILNGTGAGQPLGILNAPCLVSVSKEAGQAATTIVTENVVSMYARFNGSLNTARWFVNRNTFPQLITLKIEVGTGGTAIFLPAGQIAGQPLNTLLGVPIVMIEQCASLGTVGDIVLADMSKYALIDKNGIQSAASIHVQFLASETVFKWVYRVDGQPLYKSAITPFKGTGSTLSPFVALATRA